MTTPAERLAHRERASLAWAICDMVMQAARDDQPSEAAQAILTILCDRAPPRLRSTIEQHGFASFTALLPERAAIAAVLDSTCQDLAEQIIASLSARNKGREASRRFQVVQLPCRAISVCMALKTRLAALI